MARPAHFAFLVLTVACLLPAKALAQGETTSAIVGQVRDATDAVVLGATVTITNHETGLKRTARTDDAGRFNFPQLKPGAYSVRAEAQGFDPGQNDNVISGLGQKQSVDFVLKVGGWPRLTMSILTLEGAPSKLRLGGDFAVQQSRPTDQRLDEIPHKLLLASHVRNAGCTVRHGPIHTRPADGT